MRYKQIRTKDEVIPRSAKMQRHRLSDDPFPNHVQTGKTTTNCVITVIPIAQDSSASTVGKSIAQQNDGSKAINECNGIFKGW
jgi:hypothetical protein